VIGRPPFVKWSVKLLMLWELGMINIVQRKRWQGGLAALGLVLLAPAPVLALPPPTDLPEEYLRTKMILEARSPLDGDVLNAAEYSDLLVALEQEKNEQAAAAFLNQRYPELPNTPRYRNTRIQYPKEDPNSMDSVDYTNNPNYREVLFLLRLRKIASFFGINIRTR
jgi:hypothetical protein